MSCKCWTPKHIMKMGRKWKVRETTQKTAENQEPMAENFLERNSLELQLEDLY